MSTSGHHLTVAAGDVPHLATTGSPAGGAGCQAPVFSPPVLRVATSTSTSTTTSTADTGLLAALMPDADWLLWSATQSRTGAFGVDRAGQPLFYPNAKVPHR
ncbi:MAG: hypothetical protein WCP29_02340 [Acidobacteriota bacterium]